MAVTPRRSVGRAGFCGRRRGLRRSGGEGRSLAARRRRHGSRRGQGSSSGSASPPFLPAIRRTSATIRASSWRHDQTARNRFGGMNARRWCFIVTRDDDPKSGYLIVNKFFKKYNFNLFSPFYHLFIIKNQIYFM